MISNVQRVGLDAATLTNAYNATNTFYVNAEGYNQIILCIDYTTGAAETNNVLDWKVETAFTAGNQSGLTDLYQTTTSTDATGTVTAYVAERHYTGAAAATQYKIAVPDNTYDTNLKISFKETGVAANYGTLTVKYILSKATSVV